jgi:hypothetical protein
MATEYRIFASDDDFRKRGFTRGVVTVAGRKGAALKKRAVDALTRELANLQPVGPMATARVELSGHGFDVVAKYSARKTEYYPHGVWLLEDGEDGWPEFVRVR